MTVIEIINNVLAGGLLGSLGQGIRLVVGLKKLNAENTEKKMGGDVPEAISGGRLILSIFIGFIAGAIGMIVKSTSLGKSGNYDTESIITIIVTGYSGADFIEGVFNTYLPKFNSSTTVPVVATQVVEKTLTTVQNIPETQKTVIHQSDEDIVG
jgi:hypothetical protein